MTYVSHADEWKRTVLEPALHAGLDAAAITLQTRMRRGMGSEGGGVLRKATKKRKTDGTFRRISPGKGRNVYYPAPPGKFPGVRTGTLRRSLVWWKAPGGILLRKVGTNVFYGEYLETGTTRMRARPWANRSVEMAKGEMVSNFAKAVSSTLARGATP